LQIPQARSCLSSVIKFHRQLNDEGSSKTQEITVTLSLKQQTSHCIYLVMYYTECLKKLALISMTTIHPNDIHRRNNICK